MFPMLFDYATLKLIWWGMIGLLLILFALTDGVDFGIGMLLPWVAKDDLERRVAINVMGPHWEGNQVWLLSLGGAIFAAWPIVYATTFSMLYLALILLLWGLFFRPVAFDFRSKLQNPKWRCFWDWGMFVGSLVPSLVFGVAVGNLFLGLPFAFNDSMHLQAHAVLWQLFSPWTLGCGLLAIIMFLFQGSLYLQLKTEAPIASRALKFSLVSACAWIILFWILGLALQQMPGFQLVDNFSHQVAMLPLHKQVLVLRGAWFTNLNNYPVLWWLPRLGLILPLMAAWLAYRNWKRLAFILGSVAVLVVILSFGVSLYPFVLPSKLNPDHSLTIWDASTSQRGLNILLVFAGLLLPLISVYTTWIYKKLWKKTSVDEIKNNQQAFY